MTDASSHLAGLLDSQYDVLIDHFAARAPICGGSGPTLGPHVRELLRRLIVDLGTPDNEFELGSGAGTGLLPEDFHLEAVVLEYGLLQRLVLELLESASVPVSMRDVRRLGEWFTRAVAQAASEHQRASARQRDLEHDTQRSAGQSSGSGAQHDATQHEATPGARHEASATDRSAVVAAASEKPGREALAEALRTLLMDAPVAVCVMHGPEFVYEFTNARAKELVHGRDVVGKSVRQAFPELPQDAQVFQLLEHVYSSGETFQADEYPIALDRSGRGVFEDVYFHFTCQPIFDEQGRVSSILTVAVDIGAQVEARRRVEGLLTELRQADQRKNEFLATLAHELRNPLAAISTALSLLDEANGDASKASRYRETARRQMNTLVRLVEDLLDVARIARGLVELRREEVELGAVVQHALGATRSLIEARRHEVRVTLAPGAFRALADATRLEQVLVNLLTNAAKYTEPGGVISVSLRREDGAAGAEAVLSVRDTGRGIPRDMLERIFETFTQVAPRVDSNNGGLGLGLTLVKHLVELHGGRVSARSDGEGRGSELVVILPLAEAAAGDKPVATRSSHPPEQPRRRRVVVVEDSEDVRELLRECIEHLGHEVLTAQDGVEAVEMIGVAQPELALIDVGLPGIDGYEVARRVRASLAGREMRLVALTGYGGREVERTAKDAGFDLHVTKPIELDRLRDVLGAQLSP